MLPATLAAALQDMVGLRNILVQRYADVDDTRLFTRVVHRLADVQAGLDALGTAAGLVPPP